MKVLISFLLSATLVLIAVIVGYLSRNLPPTSLNELDHFAIARILSGFRTLCSCVPGLAPRLSEASTARNVSEAKQRRRKGLERFLLGLSDQQLVTGLAVMTAGYVQRCPMTIYHFNIVGALAWFSSAVHLATLGSLREYFIGKPSVRNWRVAGMVGLLGMLLYAQFVSFSSTDISLPLQCALESPLLSMDFPDVSVLVFTWGFLLSIYMRRVVRLFSVDPDWLLSGWIERLLVKLCFGKRRRLGPSDPLGNAKSSISIIERGKIIRAKREMRRFRQYQEKARTHRNSRIKAYVHASVFIIKEFSASFLSQIFILLADFTYAVDTTIILRHNTPAQGISGNQNTMAFGQLMPVFLLFLPCLTVYELYTGNYCDC